jgi:hypothetical protein
MQQGIVSDTVPTRAFLIVKTHTSFTRRAQGSGGESKSRGELFDSEHTPSRRKLETAVRSIYWLILAERGRCRESHSKRTQIHNLTNTLLIYSGAMRLSELRDYVAVPV